jgi:integrase
MKRIRLLPKKTPKGWRINVPPILSENGKRQRFFFASRDEAEKFVSPIRKHYRSGRFDGFLSPCKSLFAYRAYELLGDRPPEELFQAVKRWLEQSEQECSSVTFAQACEAFVASPYKAHLTETYRKYFLFYAKRFSTIANKLLVKISTKDLLKEFSEMTPSARNTTKSHLSSLWTFSIKRGWATENPLRNLERLHTPRPKIHILTAKQLRRLFVATIRLHPELVPLIAIQTFAGVRPLESVKLSWENVDMEDAILSIPDPVSKTRIGRHIEMHPTLQQWFQWHQNAGGNTHGRICPHPHMTLRRYLRKIRFRAGLNPWYQDVLRHVFASASLASDWRDIGKLCLELGHSSQKMLHRHYVRGMKRKDGVAVFSVKPMRQKSYSFKPCEQ